MPVPKRVLGGGSGRHAVVRADCIRHRNPSKSAELSGPPSFPYSVSPLLSPGRRSNPCPSKSLDLLVAPVLESGAVGRETYLPTGAHWRCARTGATYEGGTWRTLDAPLTVFHFCCRTMHIFRWPADAAGPGEGARAARRDEAVASARSFLRIPPGTGEQAFHTVEALAQDLRGPFADMVRRVLGPWAQHTAPGGGWQAGSAYRCGRRVLAQGAVGEEVRR
ncbi:hypothetical protein [Streptomyces atratus]|uniref:hypothetical protein n=1 Tax=Streptomyces atratus TaxID=1893 RepID=UPI003F696483